MDDRRGGGKVGEEAKILRITNRKNYKRQGVESHKLPHLEVTQYKQEDKELPKYAYFVNSGFGYLLMSN